MKPDLNLFAPLPTEVPFDTEALETLDLRQAGGLVETPTSGRWPARCVRCNVGVPAADFEATLAWYPRWLGLLFLAFWPLALVMQGSLKETVRIDIGMCTPHRVSRTQRLVAFGSTLVLGVAAFLGGAAIESQPVLLFGAAAGIVGLAGTLLFHAPLKVVRVDGYVAWIRVGAPFLASLPRK